MRPPGGACARRRRGDDRPQPHRRPPITQLSVTGKWYTPGELIDLAFDDSWIGTAQANQAGNFAARVSVPASALPGNHVLMARGRTSHLIARTIFTVRTDWAQFGFDLQRRGRNPFENALGAGNASALRHAASFVADGKVFLCLLIYPPDTELT